MRCNGLARKFPARSRRVAGLCIAMAVSLWAAGATATHAAGYWTCADGKWVAVGDPGYAMPTKVCGSQLEIPRTKIACDQSGGRWGPAGLFPKPICKVPTHDGGRICADTGECEGLCLAALSPAQRDLLNKRQKLQLLGKCTPAAPIFGCMAIVNAGYVTGLLCRD